MPRVEGRVRTLAGVTKGHALIEVGMDDSAALPDGEAVVVYHADEDPVAELRLALEACADITDNEITAAHLHPALPNGWLACIYDGRVEQRGRGETLEAAAQALLAKLQPPEKRVGEMTEAEKVSELLEAGWELGHWNTTIDPRIISLSITCRETGARITAFDETVSAILTKLLASAHKLRLEASDA